MSGRTVIVGQGLAGSVLAWRALWRGDEVTVIDCGSRTSASAAAAGLMMPLSGRRLARRADFEELWREAVTFYERVECEASASLFRRLQIERRFLSLAERQEWEQRPLAERMLGGVELRESGPHGALWMTGGQLHAARFLEATRVMLQQRGRLLEGQLDAESGIAFCGDGVVLQQFGLEADRLFFCEGHRGRGNIWFPGQPDQPVRGEILRVGLRQRLSAEAMVGGIWVCPVPGTLPSAEYLVGATWDRERLEEGLVTAEGRVKLLRGLGELLGEDVAASVISQYSGIRAGTRQRRVLVQVHAEHWQLGLLNGLGSWGSLLAPTAAAQLLELQANAGDQQRVGAGQRSTVKAGAPRRARPLTQLAHSIVRRAFRAGDQVLDATAGNGYDTVFLAGLAGARFVTAIDIQPQAIESTWARLGEWGSEVRLITGDHAEVLERVLQAGVESGSVSGLCAQLYGAIMFNLGYLPRSDRTVTTQPETTLRALSASLRLLRPGGVLTVIAYRGHEGGVAEYSAVREFAHLTGVPGVSADEIVGDEGDLSSPVLFVFRRGSANAGNSCD
jgi:glycine/D-amino acid oxidase-like deaminating enzyme